MLDTALRTLRISISEMQTIAFRHVSLIEYIFVFFNQLCHNLLHKLEGKLYPFLSFIQMKIVFPEQ